MTYLMNNICTENFSLHSRSRGKKYLRLWIFVQIIPTNNPLPDTN
jgi:hypothetical protein